MDQDKVCNLKFVRKLKRRLLPTLNKLCVKLNSELPEAKPEVIVSSGGGGKWYILSITCFPRENDLLHNVALQVDACSLDTSPTLQALVWWNTTLDYECELFPQAVPASDEAIERIEKSLPDLVAFLQEAARRGYPEARNKILLNGV
jgi:hypothetical protein